LSRAGIVVALAAEASTLCARLPRNESLTTLEDGTLLIVSGVGFDAAVKASAMVLEAGAKGLISFGLAGGLDPALAAGCLLLPDEVRSTDSPGVPADAAWRLRVIQALPAAAQPALGGTLWTSRTPILTTDAKAKLFAHSGALAVDMESMAVAAAARAAVVPFLAIKVIVDTALDTLPRAVMALDATGRIRAGQLAGILLRYPGELIALIRLAGRYRTALRVLRKIAAVGALRQLTVEVTSR
jgi:adenosylhomocysteine nucleosidase